MLKTYSCLLFAIFGCQQSPHKPATQQAAVQIASNWEKCNTIATRFAPPQGYTRSVAHANSFGNFLQNLPLKPAGSQVHLYDGRLKANQSVHAAVLDMDAGETDLQQCADAVMRLRAEHLFAQKQYGQIHFNLTNGFKASLWRCVCG